MVPPKRNPGYLQVYSSITVSNFLGLNNLEGRKKKEARRQAFSTIRVNTSE